MMHPLKLIDYFISRTSVLPEQHYLIESKVLLQYDIAAVTS